MWEDTLAYVPSPEPHFHETVSAALVHAAAATYRRGKTITNFCLSMQDHRGKAHSEEVMTLGTVSLSNTCPRVVAELEIRFRNPHNENDEKTPHVGGCTVCRGFGRLNRTESLSEQEQNRKKDVG